MFSRLKKLTKDKPRNLITSCLYGAYTVLAVTNLVVNGFSLSPLDIAILVPGITTLGLAIGHSIARNAHAVATDTGEEIDAVQQAREDAVKCIRPSTHNIINACLHAGSSACYITFDALILAKVSPFPAVATLPGIACRITGSSMWNLAAFTSLFHAVAHDRRKENNPEENVKALGLHPSIYNLSVEMLFIMASVFYAYEIFSESKINPIRASAIFLWQAAGLINTSAGIHAVHTRNNEKSSSSEEAATNDVVRQSPGTW